MNDTFSQGQLHRLHLLIAGLALIFSLWALFRPAYPVAVAPPTPIGPLSGAAILVMGGKIPLNQATEQDFLALPGIGPGRAAAIIRYRDRSGPFTFIGQLQKVPGIGPQTFKIVKNYVSLETRPQ